MMRLIFFLASILLISACTSTNNNGFDNAMLSKLYELRQSFRKYKCDRREQACLGEDFIGYGFTRGNSMFLKSGEENLIIFFNHSNQITALQYSKKHTPIFYSFTPDSTKKQQGNKVIENYVEKIYISAFE